MECTLLLTQSLPYVKTKEILDISTLKQQGTELFFLVLLFHICESWTSMKLITMKRIDL